MSLTSEYTLPYQTVVSVGLSSNSYLRVLLTSLSDLVAIPGPRSAKPQPIPMDINGDLKIDLFGVTPSSPSTFKVWQNVWNASQYDGPVFNMCITTYFSHRNILIIITLQCRPQVGRCTMHTLRPTLQCRCRLQRRLSRR